MVYKGQHVQNFLPVCPVCPFMFFYMFSRLLCFDQIFKMFVRLSCVQNCVCPEFPAFIHVSRQRIFERIIHTHTPHVDSSWSGRIEFWFWILAWETISTFYLTTICSFLSTTAKYKSLKLLKFLVLQNDFESCYDEIGGFHKQRTISRDIMFRRNHQKLSTSPSFLL